MAVLAAKAAAEIFLGRSGLTLVLPWGARQREEVRKSLEEKKTELVKQLLVSGIDPLLFDSLLSNEIDRRLKTRFGVSFVILTTFFTASSYAIIILNGMLDWKISTTAITGLIIETPIQFIGLLYIIARNLFPDGAKSRSGIHMGTSAKNSVREKRRKAAKVRERA
jgi:hypothetical protein